MRCERREETRFYDNEELYIFREKQRWTVDLVENDIKFRKTLRN